MTAEVERQLRKVLRKQKKLAMMQVDPIKKAQIYGTWAGFLGGMKLVGVITNKEYHKLYDQMVKTQNIESA